MKTIKINEEEYVLKADVDKKLKDTPSFKPKYILSDPCHVMALASCKIGDGYKIVRMDLNLLKRGLTIFKQLEQDEITFAFKENFPLVMGIPVEDEDRINGVIIAPRLDPDKDKEYQGEK